MGLSSYIPSYKKVKIQGTENYLIFKGLSAKDVIMLMNHYDKILTYIFDGIDITSSETITSHLIDKAPELVYSIIAICEQDENATPEQAKSLPLVTQIESLNAIIDLTKPDSYEEFQENVGKILLQTSKLLKLLKKEKNTKKK